MKIADVIPMMTVPDIGQTVAFYRDTLGFTCANQTEGWAVVRKDEAEVMFALPNQHISFAKPLFTGSFYFRTDDVDLLWEQLKNSVTVVYPVENFDYGMREFAILDNNGYCLQFGQEVE